MHAAPTETAPAGTAPPVPARHPGAVLTYPAVLALITLCGAALAFLRLPPVARDTMWAEDGTIFLEDAASHGPRSLLEPYAGYLHFLPRVLAQLVVALASPEQYALWVTAVSCLALGLVAALTYHCAQAVTDSTALRLAFASIPVVVAPGAFESSGNLANLHGYLLWLMPWLLFKPAMSRMEGVVLFTAAACAALTEIQTLLFLPLLLLVFRSRRHLPAALGLLLGGAPQVYVTLTHPRIDSLEHTLNWLSVPYGYALHSSSSILFGPAPRIGAIISGFGPAPIIVACVLLTAPVILVLWTGNGRQRLAGIVFFCASLMVWAATQVLNAYPALDYAEFQADDWLTNFFSTRYSTAPSMFLLACVPLAAAAVRNRGTIRADRSAALLLGAFTALQLVYFFPSQTARSAGPEWSPQFETVRAQCDAGTDTVSIESAPEWWDPVILRCP